MCVLGKDAEHTPSYYLSLVMDVWPWSHFQAEQCEQGASHVRKAVAQTVSASPTTETLRPLT